jgi:tetratricopeptide (TPR) repeat protein
VSDFADRGDAARRASTRLVIEGLDADTAAALYTGKDSAMELRRAQGSYERAIQVDPTNPYAYLALARHHLDGGDATEAANLVDQSAALFEGEGLRSPEVEVQLIGLRGLSFDAQGRPGEAELYLHRAGALAPGVWGDGYLSAEELR